MLHRLVPFLARESRPAKAGRDDFSGAYAAWQDALAAFAGDADWSARGKSISLEKTLRERQEIERLYAAWIEASKSLGAWR
jgi:hypothetical protein